LAEKFGERGKLKVEVLAGSGSIGGNFVRIEDGDRVLIFDQGIRFDIMGRYYAGIVSPRGVAELRNLGVLPKPEWYENSDSIYVSHMHLDHLGALSNIPTKTQVHLPNISIYEDMEERRAASPTWLSLVPRKYYVSFLPKYSRA
jgi:ribonuclease J